MKNWTVEVSEDSKGLQITSFVADPAIKSPLMFLHNEVLEALKFQDEERGVIYAPSMIPDKLIPRRNINGEPGNIYFTKETILKLHLLGCKNNYDQKINLNHDQKNTIPDVYCFESWIIEDTVHDKSVKLGFDLPIGTLMKGYKIDNEQIKEDIKSGKITGLSVEFLPENFVEDKQLNFKNENMNKKTIIDKIIALFADEKTEYASGMFGTSLEKGAVISDAEGNPVKDAEFDFEGNKYKTDAEGKISEITPVEELEADPDPAADPADDKDAKILELETKIADLEAQLTEANAVKMANEEAEVKLKADFEAATTELKTATEKVIKLEADLVDAVKIKAFHKEEPIPYEKMTNAQKVKFNREK